MEILEIMPAPLRGGEQVLGKHADGEASFEQALSDLGRSVALNLASMLRATDPEGPHQTRVALRKLRTVLWVHKSAIEPVTAAALSQGAKNLARAAAPVRDADVLALEIAPAAQAALDKASAELLARMLEAHRAARRAAFLESGAAVDGAAFLLALHRYQIDRLWRGNGDARPAKPERLSQPARKICAHALDKALRRVRGWGARLEELSVEERHEMRKALKRLRYTAGYGAPFFPQKRVRSFMAELRALQNVFGYLNDVAGAESLRAIAESGPPETRPVLRRAANLVIDHHQAAADAAWSKACKRWRSLEKTRAFW